MKSFTTSLIFTFILIIGGCSLGASWPQQVTALNVNCDADTTKISDKVVDLNGEESWTATCGDKTYYCTYLSASDSNCYEINK